MEVACTRVICSQCDSPKSHLVSERSSRLNKKKINNPLISIIHNKTWAIALSVIYSKDFSNVTYGFPKIYQPENRWHDWWNKRFFSFTFWITKTRFVNKYPHYSSPRKPAHQICLIRTEDWWKWTTNFCFSQVTELQCCLWKNLSIEEH